MNRTLGLMLAGEHGNHLGALTQLRAKAAIPFAGAYRVIDFALSNATNSGLHRLGILTRSNPESTINHIGHGEAWGYTGRTRGIEILPAPLLPDGQDWYEGTADAVRQNMAFLDKYSHCDLALIIAGDHIYRMNYDDLVKFHRQRNADVTVATVNLSVEEASEFGIAMVDHNQRIFDWEEKPDIPRSNLATIGIYVFSMDYLKKVLQEHPGNHFGLDIIPFSVQKAAIFAYPFSGYWRNLATIKKLWLANLDVLDREIGLNPWGWKIYPNVYEENQIGDYPPTYVGQLARVENSLISQGCVVHGVVKNSIISPGVFVDPGTVISESIVMNNCRIGANVKLDRAILDEEVRVDEGAVVGYGEVPPQATANQPLLEAGLTVVGRGVRIPAGQMIGRHCMIYPGIGEKDFPSRKMAEGTTLG